MKTNVLNNWPIIIILCLTLGLAPYTPQPHIIGKIKWVLGGAKGMKAIDYFDLFLHGFPWILLLAAIYLKITNKTLK